MSGKDDLGKKMAGLRRQEAHAKRQNDLREKRRLDKARRAQPRTSLLERFRHRWWFRAAEWIIGTVGVALGIVVSIAGIWGPIWPTDPEIHPHDVLDGSSFILPFTVKNRSILFDIRDAEFTCGIDWLYYRAKPITGTFEPMAFRSGSYSIPVGSRINYLCDASQILKTGPDGTLKLGEMVFPPGAPGTVRVYPPLIVLKACIWIRVDYKVFGIIPRHFTSGIFQWPASPDVAQWLEGPTLQPNQITKEEWFQRRGNTSPHVVGCSAEAHKPVIVFDRNGKSTLRE